MYLIARDIIRWIEGLVVLSAHLAKGENMTEKYDLNRMLREIKQDETVGTKKSRRLTQDEIKQMVAQKKKTADEART